MTISQFLVQYWQFIISIGAVIAGWWRMSLKLSNWKVLNDVAIADLKSSQSEMKAKFDSVYPILTTLQTDMASVKTSLEFIKGSVTQIMSKNQ